MKGRPKSLRKLMKAGVCPVLWQIHFRRRPDKATCFDCADFRAGLCEGGGDPIECLREQTAKLTEEPLLFSDPLTMEPVEFTCPHDCRRCEALSRWHALLAEHVTWA
jgi:hypothetical protein